MPFSFALVLLFSFPRVSRLGFGRVLLTTFPRVSFFVFGMDLFIFPRVSYICGRALFSSPPGVSCSFGRVHFFSFRVVSFKFC